MKKYKNNSLNFPVIIIIDKIDEKGTKWTNKSEMP